MGRSLAYTPNISSSSESSVHTTVDTPKALYDRRERVRNVWHHPMSFPDCLNHQHFRHMARDIISFPEASSTEPSIQPNPHPHHGV